MPSILPTYAQYTAWGFQGTQAGFNALLTPAVATVDACIPVVNEVDESDAEQVAAYQKAICGTIAYLQDNPEGGVKSYTAGKVREEFAEAQTAAEVARKYLHGSGLLCMWP